MSGSQAIPPIPLRIEGGEAFNRVLDEAGRAAERFAQRAQGTGQQLGALSTMAQSSGGGIGVLSTALDAASTGLDRIAGQFGALSPVMGEASGTFSRLAAMMTGGGGVLAAVTGIASAVGLAVTVWQNWSSIIDQTTGRFAGARGALDLATGSTDAYRRATEALTAALNQNANAERARAAARGQQLVRDVQPGIDEMVERLAETQRDIFELINRRGAQAQLDEYRRIHGPDAYPPEHNTGARDIRALLTLRDREASQRAEIERLRSQRASALLADEIGRTPDPRAGENGPGDYWEARNAYLDRRNRGGSRAPDAELMAGWGAVQDQNRDREAAERREAADWDREQERRQQAAERAAERMAESNRRVTDRIVDYSAERFSDMFDKNGRGWEGMLETFESTAKSTFARIAAELALRPIITPVVQALGLGALGNGNGGFSGLGGLIGGGGVSAGGGSVGVLPTMASSSPGGGLGGLLSLGGGGSGGGLFGGVGSFLTTPLWGGATSISSLPAVPSASSIAGVVPMAGPSIAGLAAGIGGGYMIGSTLGNYIAKTSAQRTNAQIGAAGGAAAGAIIGSIIPGVGTVIGGLVGGAIGGGGGGLIGPGSSFSGGDVGVGVGPDGLLRVTGTGGKNWNAGAAQDATQQQLDQINAMLRAGGVSISGVSGYDWKGGDTIGFAGSGGSKNVFGPTEIFQRVRSGLTSSNDNMRTALQSSTVQSFGDIGGIAQWLASTYEPLSKVADFTRDYADAIAAQNKVYDDAIGRARELGLAEAGLVAAREKSLAATLGARDTSVHNALSSLQVDELRATGNTADAQRASWIEFDLSSSQRLTQLQDFLRGNGYGDDTSLFQSSVSRLNSLFDVQRKTLAEQLAESFGGSGRALMEELTVGDLGGLSPRARYLAGVKTLQDARESGNLDRLTAAARSVLPVARDFLGSSEAFGSLTASISRDVRRLGGDPVGLGVFLEGQAAGNQTLERLYTLGSSQLSELQATRAEIARLNAIVTTLMQRQAA